MNPNPTTDVTGSAPANKQPGTVEGLKTPPEAATPDPKVDPLSPKFAALARQQKAVRESQRALEAREAAVKAQLAEVESLKSWKDSLTKNPLKVMQEAGLTYDQLTKIVMAEPDSVLTPEDMRAQRLEKEIEDLKAAGVTEKQQSYEQAKKSILNEVTSIVATNTEFEVLKATGQENDVVDRIESHFKETGLILDYEMAAKTVQDEFLSEFIEIARLPAIQARLNPPAPAAIPEPEKQVPAALKPQQTTLSNRMPPTTTRPSTWKEKRERAIAIAEGRAPNS